MKLIHWSKLRVSVLKANKYKEVTDSSEVISLLACFRLDPMNADILPFSRSTRAWSTLMPEDVDWSGFPEPLESTPNENT